MLPHDVILILFVLNLAVFELSCSRYATIPLYEARHGLAKRPSRFDNIPDRASIFERGILHRNGPIVVCVGQYAAWSFRCTFRVRFNLLAKLCSRCPLGGRVVSHVVGARRDAASVCPMEEQVLVSMLMQRQSR